MQLHAKYQDDVHEEDICIICNQPILYLHIEQSWAYHLHTEETTEGPKLIPGFLQKSTSFIFTNCIRLLK